MMINFNKRIVRMLILKLGMQIICNSSTIWLHFIYIVNIIMSTPPESSRILTLNLVQFIPYFDSQITMRIGPMNHIFPNNNLSFSWFDFENNLLHKNICRNVLRVINFNNNNSSVNFFARGLPHLFRTWLVYALILINVTHARPQEKERLNFSKNNKKLIFFFF